MTDETAPTAPTGRRERKKLATRDALREAARTLFAQQGVAATSVEQISEAADVSERTFFRYFESKYDLLLPDLAALFDAVVSVLAGRPPGEHPLDAYCAALEAILAGQDADGRGMTMIAPGLDPSDPAVTSRLARAFVSWEDRLTELFEARFRESDAAQDDRQAALFAAVTAGVAVAGTRAAVRLVRRDPTMPPSQRLGLLRDVFAIIRTGCTDDAITAAAFAT